jgi:hypothetical protein
MKAVNEKSKSILNKLWELADKNGYYKLNNDPTFIPVTLEIVGKNQLSVCHYGECNGDLMRDPEMVFYKQNDDWFPIYFRNDWVGVEEISYRRIDGKLVAVNEKYQHDQAEFANIWMVNIKDQQGLELENF